MYPTASLEPSDAASDWLACRYHMFHLWTACCLYPCTHSSHRDRRLFDYRRLRHRGASYSSPMQLIENTVENSIDRFLVEHLLSFYPSPCQAIKAGTLAPGEVNIALNRQALTNVFFSTKCHPTSCLRVKEESQLHHV